MSRIDALATALVLFLLDLFMFISVSLGAIALGTAIGMYLFDDSTPSYVIYNMAQANDIEHAIIIDNTTEEEEAEAEAELQAWCNKHIRACMKLYGIEDENLLKLVAKEEIEALEREAEILSRQ